jgi:alpha-galactosidase
MDTIPRNDIKTNILGINHLTWIDRAYYKNIDLMPLFKEFTERFYDDGYEMYQNDPDDMKPFRSKFRVRFDLFRRYGLIGAAGDRHMVEFLPPWYLKGPDEAQMWKFALTSVDFRISKMNHLLEYRKRILNGEEALVLKPSSEEGVRQIKALLGLDEIVTNVNFPNKGQMPDYPEDVILETNVHISGMGIKPVIAGQLPPEINSMVIRHVYNQEIVVKAALQKDKSLAFKAFVNDPLVTLSLHDSEALFNEMLHNTREYLPGWDL